MSKWSTCVTEPIPSCSFVFRDTGPEQQRITILGILEHWACAAIHTVELNDIGRSAFLFFGGRRQEYRYGEVVVSGGRVRLKRNSINDRSIP